MSDQTGQGGAETFGQRLRRARRELSYRLDRDVYQEDVAKAVGVSSVAYGRWESDQREPDLATVRQLAKYYGVRVGYLVAGELPKRDLPAHAAQGTPSAPAPLGAAPTGDARELARRVEAEARERRERQERQERNAGGVKRPRR